MGLGKMLEKLINEHGSAVILKERLELMKDQAIAVENENTNLKAKNATLTRRVTQLASENAMLHSRLARSQKAEDFVEYEGAAFKRRADGTFHQTIYCPIHHLPASAMDGVCPYMCPQKDCGWTSPITPNTLKSVIAKITPGTLSNKIDNILL